MANSNISKGKTMLMLLALGIAGGSIYILPYFRYVFYDQMIEVMNINNTQLGTVSSMYSIVAMILFLFGGVIADKFDAKKLVLISLIGTTILTVIFAFYSEGFVTALIIWAGLAVTTGATFWSAFIKFINSIGDEKDSGKTFGIYYAINGITGAVINAVALAVSTRFSDVRQGFFAALMVVAASTLIATIMIFLFIDGSRGKDQKSDEDEFRLSDIKYVAKNPGVWLLAAFG